MAPNSSDSQCRSLYDRQLDHCSTTGRAPAQEVTEWQIDLAEPGDIVALNSSSLSYIYH